MPEMDGGQLAQAAQEKFPDLPVLFVSGYTGGVLARHGVKEDSLYFLRKPFRARELLERVDQILTQPSRG
jgi:FixJ family two-component response regulator